MEPKKTTFSILTILAALLLSGCASVTYPIKTGAIDLKIGTSTTVLKAGGFLPGTYTPGAASLDPEIVSVTAWDHEGDFVKDFIATGVRAGTTRIVFLSQLFTYPESPEELHPDVREAALERLRGQTRQLPETATYAERRRTLIEEAAATRTPITVTVSR